MDKILSSRDIFKILTSGERSTVSFKPWNNTFQKWMFICASGGLALGALLAVLSKQETSTYLRWVALITLVFSQLSAVLYQIAVVLPSVRAFGNPTKSFFLLAEERFNDDIQKITQLADSFDQHSLDYALDLLTQLGDQLRFRIGFMVGTIEKVGVLPSAVAGYIYAKDILKKPDYPTGIEWIFAGLIAFYILAIVFVTVSQRIEHLALIVKHAAAKKASNVKFGSAAKDG